MPGLLVGVRRKQGAVCLCSLLIYRPFILLILIVQQNIKKVNWQGQGKRIENWRTKLDSVIRFKYSVSLVALLEVISRGSCVGRFQIIFSCLFFVLISNISPHFCCGLSPFSVLVWKKIFLDTCDGLFFYRVVCCEKTFVVALWRFPLCFWSYFLARTGQIHLRLRFRVIRISCAYLSRWRLRIGDLFLLFLFPITRLL